MEKLIIEVRINEYAPRTHNANVPFSPAEICEDALQCWRAGASIIHYHARDPKTGAPSAQPGIYADTARRIKDKSDLLVVPTLGAWTLPSPEARMSHIIEMAKDPTAKPDFAPIDMATSNVDVYDASARRFLTDDVVYMNTTRTLQYFARTIREAGVRPLVALWNVSGIRLTSAFAEAGLFETPIYAEIVLTEGAPGWASRNRARTRKHSRFHACDSALRMERDERWRESLSVGRRGDRTGRSYRDWAGGLSIS
jgi:uncharacterized protein (DUF849 family)